MPCHCVLKYSTYGLAEGNAADETRTYEPVRITSILKETFSPGNMCAGLQPQMQPTVTLWTYKRHCTTCWQSTAVAGV